MSFDFDAKRYHKNKTQKGIFLDPVTGNEYLLMGKRVPTTVTDYDNAVFVKNINNSRVSIADVRLDLNLMVRGSPGKYPCVLVNKPL